MITRLIHVGFNNMVAVDRIVGITSPSSAPAKRSITDARVNGRLVDMTNGRKTKSVIFEERGFIILSALAPDTIQGRIMELDNLPVDPSRSLMVR